MRPDEVNKIIADVPYMTLEQGKRIIDFIGRNTYTAGTLYFKIKANCRGAVEKAAGIALPPENVLQPTRHTVDR